MPLSDLDSAASGKRQTGGAGGTPTGGVSATGGSAEDGGTPTSGGAEPTGGAGGTGGVATGGQGGNAEGGSPPTRGGAGGIQSGGAGGLAGASNGGVATAGAAAGMAGAAGTVESAGMAGAAGMAGSGAVGGEGGTGGTQCVGNLRDCDTNPDDCETDITSDPDHCGGCDKPCLGELDECIDSRCVSPPCTWDTATLMAQENYDYRVPGNGCVKIDQQKAGYFHLQAEVEVPFTYEDQCGNSGSGTIPWDTGSDPIVACPVTIDLLGLSNIIKIRWWNSGGG